MNRKRNKYSIIWSMFDIYLADYRSAYDKTMELGYYHIVMDNFKFTKTLCSLSAIQSIEKLS